MITFTLDKEIAAGIINMLGTAPTQSGAYPVYQELLKQYTTQVNESVEAAQKEEKHGD